MNVALACVCLGLPRLSRVPRETGGCFAGVGRAYRTGVNSLLFNRVESVAKGTRNVLRESGEKEEEMT